MSRLTMEVRRMIADMDAWRRNAKVLVATEIFWAPSIWIFFYQAVFMREMEFNEVLIGVSLTLPLIFETFLPMLGGSLADKFGRERVMMFFHAVGWTGYSGYHFFRESSGTYY